MLPRRLIRARLLPSIPRRIAAAQEGSFLVEAMVSSLIIVIVGLGVLESIDRSSRLGGEQKTQAVAGNVAQSEQEELRALPLSEQSNLRRSTTRTVGGVTYTIASRADWVNDTTGDASCATAGSSADYMKVSTTVSWPQMGTRKPIALSSLIAPGVKAFDSTQGSLALQVTDRAGAGVSGMQVNLSGPATLTDTTNASGCVLWGYLPAGSGYAVGFTKPPDYVTTDGSTVVSRPATVVGQQTSNVAVQYDRGGYLQTSFWTQRAVNGTKIASSPLKAHVTNAGGGGVSIAVPVAGSVATSGLLFPFTSAYTMHADSCAAAEVPTLPSPAQNPPTPAAPSATAGIVASGLTTTATSPSPSGMQLPSPNIRVRSGSPLALRAGLTVRVTTPCGTVISRTTTTNGVLADPGFPYATNLDICVSDGTRQVLTSHDNMNFNNGLNFTIDIPSTAPLGTCP
ncbi:MAG: hypothetical protein QOJ35_475 [Solirubrobacteraceae bacterium]|jgi:hypothetical protein|nr:hypothetical protein [Solirubrobacteraceae bacterium]